MPQLPQRLGLNLPDALSGHPKLPAHLFQSAASPTQYPEPQLQHPAFPVTQGVKRLIHLLLKDLIGSNIDWSRCAPVPNEILQMKVLFLSDGSCQRYWCLIHFLDFLYPCWADSG